MDASVVPSAASGGHQDNEYDRFSAGAVRARTVQPVSLIAGVRGGHIATAATITVVFVTLQIRASLYAGTLSLPPTYDDVMYYVDAAKSVRIFWHNGIMAVLSEYIANPPHAPGATFLAAIGFLLLGVNPWAANIANALPLFAFVLILMWLFSGLPTPITISAVLAMLAIPIFGVAIVEFRPDMWCAGLTVLGTLVIALRDPREKKTAVAAGIALAAVLLMKPTFSPLALILYAAASVLRLAPYAQDPAQRRPSLRAYLIIGILALAIAGPHYILALHLLVHYYKLNFGAHAHFWSPVLSRAETVFYYLTGPGGALAIGPWAYAGALTLPVPFILFLKRRYVLVWQASIVAILALIAYAAVTVVSNKSAFLGVIFPSYIAGAIIISAALGLRFLFSRKMIGMAYVATGTLLLFAVATYRLPWLRMHQDFVFPAEVTASRHQILQEVASFLEDDPAISQKTVMFAQKGSYLNADVLSFIFLQKDLSMPSFVEDAFSSDLTVQGALAARAQYVVTLTRDYPDTISWLPSANVGEAFDASMPQAGFELAKAITPRREAGAIRIYKRIRS